MYHRKQKKNLYTYHTYNEETVNITKVHTDKEPIMYTFVGNTGKMRQLVVVSRICCCSQSMIFLLELLGRAKQL